MHTIRLAICFLSFSAFASAQQSSPAAETINLPTGKTLARSASSATQTLNSFPVALAVSPDGRYVAVLNNGYGTPQSDGKESIAILDLQTNQVADFPDKRLARNAKQTYYLGLAFSPDGKHLYASMASMTDPETRLRKAAFPSARAFSTHRNCRPGRCSAAAGMPRGTRASCPRSRPSR